MSEIHTQNKNGNHNEAAGSISSLADRNQHSQWGRSMTTLVTHAEKIKPKKGSCLHCKSPTRRGLPAYRMLCRICHKDESARSQYATLGQQSECESNGKYNNEHHAIAAKLELISGLSITTRTSIEYQEWLKLLSILSPIQRRVVVLSIFHKMYHEQISEHIPLNVSRERVRQILEAALGQLAKSELFGKMLLA